MLVKLMCPNANTSGSSLTFLMMYTEAMLNGSDDTVSTFTLFEAADGSDTCFPV